MLPLITKIATGLTGPTAPLEATLTRIPTDQPLPRSSHSLSIIQGRAYIFGGEVQPREPADNEMHVFILPSSAVSQTDYQAIPPLPGTPNGGVPDPRLGHSAAVIGHRIYVWGGRSGKDMKALDENGRVWVFSTRTSRWSSLDPAPGSPVPPPRSYHSSTSCEHPLPDPRDKTEHPIVEDEAKDFVEPVTGHGTIFIHAGCDASGGRLSDVWAFDIAARTWSPFPDAPGPARGGACLTFAGDRLYRFGGFDGQSELGGQLDYLDISVAMFDDQGGKGELCVSPQSGQWHSIAFAPNGHCPGPRSVAGLHRVTTGQGRSYLLLLMGERSPSNSGHGSAGQFWDDIWSFQLKPDGMTSASVKDGSKSLLGRKTGEETWAEVKIVRANSQEQDLPQACGWFASATMDIDQAKVVIWGGLNGLNERVGSGWIVSVQ